MLFLTIFPTTLSGGVNILSINSLHQLLGRCYIPESDTQVQRREVYQFFLLKRDQHYASIYFLGIFKTLVMQLATCAVTKDSKLSVMQRNWKVNKKQLRIQTAIWLRVLYPEAGLASSRMPGHALQPNFILCISSGNHWNKKYLISNCDPPPVRSKNVTAKGSHRKWEVIQKENRNVCFYLFRDLLKTSKILLSCIFWGFHDHVKLLHLGKAFLFYCFWFILP